MRLLDASDALSVVPPFFFGVLSNDAVLDHVVLDYEQQRCIDLANVRMVSEHHQRHQLQLLTVRVLVIARLVVNHPRSQVLIIDNQKVCDAPNPYFGVFPTAWVKVYVQRHLVFAQLSTGPTV